MFFFLNSSLIIVLFFCANTSHAKVTKFIETKCNHIFNSILDRDKSGYLDNQDFDALTEQFGKLRSWRISDVKYKQLVSDVAKFRDGMFEDMDPDHTGRINKTQWVDSWERFAKNNGTRCKWQQDYENFAFHFSDVDGNGLVTTEEFAPIFIAFQTPENEVREACKKAFMGKDSMDITHFTRLWTEYYISNDPNDPGNFLVGQMRYKYDED